MCCKTRLALSGDFFGWILNKRELRTNSTQALAAELEHRRGLELALAEAIDRALADEERVASVILVLHSQGGSLR
jgi:hypothetical protein